MKDKMIENCQENILHDEAIERVLGKLPSEEQFINLSEFYKAFSDPTRLKILSALFHTELCVCDLVKILNITQPAVSYQLKLLKYMRLVKFRKEGKSVFYALDDSHIKEIFQSGLEHIRE